MMRASPRQPPFAPFAPFALLALLAALAACIPPAKHETAALASAVDRFRRADNAAKPDLANTAKDLRCTDAAVCAARDACFAAMSPTARALVLKDEVARKLDDIEHGRLSRDSPEASDLAGKLDEAEKLLTEGRTKWASCERSLGALRVQYGV
jgi:hypothetical protein